MVHCSWNEYVLPTYFIFSEFFWKQNIFGWCKNNCSFAITFKQKPQLLLYHLKFAFSVPVYLWFVLSGAVSATAASIPAAPRLIILGLLFRWAAISEGRPFCPNLLWLHSSNAYSGVPEKKKHFHLRGNAETTAFLLQGRKKIDFSHLFTVGESLWGQTLK